MRERTLIGIFIFLNFILVINEIILSYRVFVKKQKPELHFFWSLSLDNNNIVLGILNYVTMVFDIIGIVGLMGYYIGEFLF